MRFKKLIRPKLQLRLTFWFVCLSVVSLGVQFILFTSAMSGVALEMPGDAAANFDRFASVFVEVFVQSLFIVLPLTVMTGVVATFKIAGPIHGIITFFEAVLRNEHPDECRIRKGDELQELCTLANQVTEPLRATLATRLGRRGNLSRLAVHGCNSRSDPYRTEPLALSRSATA